MKKRILYLSKKINNYPLTDKTVTFLWRDDYHDKGMSIFINEDFCKTISEPERAALGYIATYIGNECTWDGDYTENRSNLRCKIISALHLGYQCSDEHLGFLRQWFRKDKQVLEKLKSCPTIPETSTIQDTFNEIILNVKGNEISVFYNVYAINLREKQSWSWTETAYFQVENDNIRLIKTEKSNVIQEHLNVEE